VTGFPRGRLPGGRFGLSELVLAIVLCSIWFLALKPAIDWDYGWHIENGRRLLDGSAFGGRDLYSWTAKGEWIVHEWVTEIVMAVLHDSAGATVNSFLFALLPAIAFFVVALRLKGRGYRPAAVIVTVTLGFLCTMMSLGVRPQLLELVYLAATLQLVEATVSGRLPTKRVAVIAALFSALWANTHGSFPVLTVVLGLSAAGWLIDRHRVWRSLLVGAVVSAIAAMINPWGWRIYAFATQSMLSDTTLGSINEWKRPDLTSGSLVPFDIAAILAAVAAAIAIAQRFRARGTIESTGPRTDDVLLFVAFLYLALTSGRHVMLFGIAAAPLIAWTGSALIGVFPTRASRTPDADASAKERINLAAAFVVAAVLLTAGLLGIGPSSQSRAAAARYPVGIVEAVRTRLGNGARLFNEYDWGGFLIERGLTPVFIDGRSELYGDEQLRRYAGISRVNEGWNASLDTAGADIAVLRRGSPLAEALSRAGWTTEASDAVGVLLQRPR
jgi:hypothetical protein